MVKPKTSSSYEIDVFDTLMRETKHLTTNTPADKLNTNPIWSKDGKFIDASTPLAFMSMTRASMS